MSNLVQLLTDEAELARTKEQHDLLLEAAARIAQLEEANTASEDEIAWSETQQRRAEKAEARIAQLEAENDMAAGVVRKAEARIAQLEAVVEHLPAWKARVE